MDRRSFISMSVASSVAMATGISRAENPATSDSQIKYPKDQKNLKARWEKLDTAARGWWDGDLERADEKAIREGIVPHSDIPTDTHRSSRSLIFLPFPYSSGGGSVGSFPEMYGWDTYFISRGLLAHDRTDIVRWNILDQLAMIERFGVVLGANRTWCVPRGQPPMLAMNIEKYLAMKKDDDEVAMLAYPLLERSYLHYWNGPNHSTPIGLSTCNTPNCTDLAPELSAEGEAGLDFTPIFDGDIQHCVPIHVNCALVRQAQVLSSLAERFRWSEKAARWRKEANSRAALINRYCWDDKEGCYFEYNFARKTRLPYYSLNAYWPLWIGIASPSQAKRVADHLYLFNRLFGLTFTDKTYPNPHPEFKALEWAYPECWPQQQIVVGEALNRYGFHDQAREISQRYIANVVTTWEKTGLTWERYDGVVGGHSVPMERHEPRPLHGFSSASAVVVGRIAFS
jgi:alpha,alpha-trehalase